MGSIIGQIFSGSEGESGVPNFDNPTKPSSEADIKLHGEAASFLENSQTLLSNLQSYQCAQEAIKAAIEDPDAEEHSFGEVLPKVKLQGDFWRSSELCGDIVVRLLVRLGQEKEDITRVEALWKQYAQIISFGIRWDFEKMMKSNIQNDLAFYRRCMDRQARNYDLPVSQDHTAYISMFLAQSLPFIKTIATKINSGITKGKTELSQTLLLFTNASQRIISKKKWGENSQYYDMTLQALAGSVVLFDHVDSRGAFKTKAIKIKKVVTLISKWENAAVKGQLSNLIKFGCPNYDKHASSSIENLLA